MSDVEFVLGFAIFSAALLAVPFFLLSRGVDARKYLRPVIYGVFFSFVALVAFGAGSISFIIGGMVTGYVLAREVAGFTNHFKGGALVGIMTYTSSVVAIAALLLQRGVTAVWPTGDLVLLSGYTGLFLFRDLILIGGGAGLGGMLRKFMAPATAAEAGKEKPERAGEVPELLEKDGEKPEQK